MVIDCHTHVRACPNGALDEKWCAALVEAGELLGIDIFCVSDLDLTGDISYERFHAANERVLEAMNHYPENIKGWCFVNPGDPRALDEIDQRIRKEGFIGIKLYNQFTIDDPVQDPILRKAAEWNVPVLVHAGRPTDAATCARQPYISDAGHFVRAARRHPDTILIHAHIGGGGDWEWALKYLREVDSVYVDTSGSVVDEALMDRCIEELGVSRILFATDMTMEGCLGKVLDASLSPEERRAVFEGNFNHILARRTVG